MNIIKSEYDDISIDKLEEIKSMQDNLYNIEIHHGEEPDPLQYGQYTDEWIDAHAILPKRSIQDYLDLCTDSNDKIVISAPTGSGKSLRLSQAIAYETEYHGIIAVHCKAAGIDLYNKIIALNPRLKPIIKLLFCDESGYDEYINDPEELGRYQWIIMYKDRIYYGDVDQFLQYDKSDKPIIISDETIIGSDEYHINDDCISIVEEIVNYRSPNMG